MKAADFGNETDHFVLAAYMCGIELKEIERELKRRWIRLALRQNEGNLVATAAELKLHRNNLLAWIKTLGLEKALADIRAAWRRPARSRPQSDKAVGP